MSRAAGVAVLAGLLASGSAAAEPVDHYVLALSWSPTYCAERRPSDAPLQCGLDADRTFIVHGLWPNLSRGSASYCDAAGRAPSADAIAQTLDVMPSRSLIRHQWRKHGTCSGLDGDAYLAKVRAAAKRTKVPPGLAGLRKTIEVRPAVLREAFMAANAGLREDGIYVRCRGEDLIDVRICLTPELEFQACPNVRNRRCRTRLLEVDPPR